MPRGGPRPGSGRKKGTVSAATKERLAIAEAAASAGVMPLDVMLITMRALWDQAHANAVTDAKLQMQAVAVAEKAAPFVHPKLSNVQADVGLTNHHEAALDELE